MKRKYFGTNGIRGVVGDLMTPDFVSKMSSAIASYMLEKGTMVIGSDSRLSSPSIKENVISSFLAQGIEVIDLGVVPTPLVQYAVPHLQANMGIAVTASHNPPEFNGIKVIDSDGIEIDIPKQKGIEDIYETETFQIEKIEDKNNVTRMNLISDYVNQIISFVDVDLIQKRKLAAVVDGGNAVGGVVTPYILGKLGVRVVSVNCQLDGKFPGRSVEPDPAKLSTMGFVANQTTAHFSIAHDGDADRAIFGDEKGKVYFGDKSITLFEKWILENSDNKQFVTPVSSSSAVVDIAEELGGTVTWTPVGCIYVSRKMIADNCILGGEENGGLFYAPHQSVRDGMMAAALMANILAETQEPLSSLISKLPQYHQIKEKINCPNTMKERVMAYIQNNVQADEIITLDGVKLIFTEGWILIRPSGTEPIFRIFVEARNEEQAERLLKQGLDLVNQALQKCK
jgi:phosphomannomutase/phosphoglucomutase